jgi:DNA-binding PadR family transcriptional regulator
MEADGLLVSHRVVEDGRQVRRYAVTERGIETLREGENYLRELCHELLGHDRTDGGRP